MMTTSARSGRHASCAGRRCCCAIAHRGPAFAQQRRRADLRRLCWIAGRRGIAASGPRQGERCIKSANQDPPAHFANRGPTALTAGRRSDIRPVALLSERKCYGRGCWVLGGRDIAVKKFAVAMMKKSAEQAFSSAFECCASTVPNAPVLVCSIRSMSRRVPLSGCGQPLFARYQVRQRDRLAELLRTVEQR